MIRWLRTTLPSGLVLSTIGFGYLVALGFLPWFDARPYLIGIVLAAYAAHRITSFHPVFNADFRHWLELMPWDRQTRPPFGPVHLVAQDAIVVSILIVLATVGFFPLRLDLTPYAAVCWAASFLMVYLLFAIYLMFATNMYGHGYGILFVMVIMLYVWWLPGLAFGLMLAAYLIAAAGIRRGYREFPWGMRRKYAEDYDFAANRVAQGRDAMMNPDGRAAANVDIFELPGLRLIKYAFQDTFLSNRRLEYDLAGPLLESLAPIGANDKGRTERAILNSALIAWAFYVFSSLERGLIATPTLSLIAYFLCIFGANLIRTAIYSASVYPLVNIPTRMLWPRWLLTSYDRPCMTSLTGLIVGILLPLPLVYLGVQFPAAIALSAFVYFALIQRWGISFAEWKLTGRGHQRFRYSQQPGQQAIQFNDAFLIYLAGFACLLILCAIVYDNPMDLARRTDQAASVNNRSLKLQLMLGANPNRASSSGLTPLETAALTGNNEAIRILIAGGAVQNYGINNPLHLATITSHTQTMTELIRLGADVNIRSAIHVPVGDIIGYYDVTPLQLSAMTGNIPAAKILLDAKADVRAGSSTSGPPLECTLQRGNLEMAQLLVSHGAKLELARPKHGELNEEDGEDYDLIRTIGRSGDWNTFQFMLSVYPDFDARSKAGAAALYGVAENQSVEGQKSKAFDGIQIANWLVKHGADVNAKDPDGNTSDTALHLAARSVHPEIVGFLADHGAKIDAQNEYGATPLVNAIRGEQLDNAKILLEHGAQPNIADKLGNTPLLAAAGNVSVSSEMVKFLIDRGANINATNNDHKNAIELAAGRRPYEEKNKESLNKISILLDAQPDPQARAEQTRVALAAARNANWDDAVRFLGGVIDTNPKQKPGLNFRLIAIRLIFALSIILLWVRAAVIVRRPPNRLAPTKIRHGLIRVFVRNIRARLGPLLIPLLALVVPQIFLFLACMLVVVFFMLPLPLEHNSNFIAANAALLAGCCLYGLLRGVLLHPVFNHPYREWLGMMPWDHTKPLPMGPAQFTPKDLIAVALVWLLTYPSQLLFPSNAVDRIGFMALALICILAPYIFAVMASFVMTGHWTGFFILAFGAGAAGLLYQNPGWVLLALAVMYGIADIFLGRAIAQFPWKNPRAEPWLGTSGVRRVNVAREFILELFNSTIVRKTDIGMPQNALVPLDSSIRLPLYHGLMISALAGWITFVLSKLFGGFPEGAAAKLARIHEANPLLWVCPGALIVFAAYRIAVYATANLPPIGFWGRILTGRWIIPGYDVILVVPILSIATMLFLPDLLARWGVHAIWVYPIAVAISLAILLNLGPTLTQWRLTGAHRIVPKNLN